MKKVLGIFLIGCSLLIASVNWPSNLHHVFIYALILIGISIPIYLAGHLLRTSKKEFVSKWLRWLIAYLAIVIITPVLFITMNHYEELKFKTFSNEQFILFGSSAGGNLDGLSLMFVLVLIIMIFYRIFNEDIRRKWILTLMIVITFIAYGTYQYTMWTDYRGIHEDKGLVMNKWNGTGESIPWEEVTQITIEPYIHYARLSNTSDETHISWLMNFHSNTNKPVSYRFSNLFDRDLEIGNQVKQLAHLKSIPFVVNEMSNKERKWFDFELELNKLEPEPYYDFFQID